MAPNFKTHTVLLSVLGKLTINANESQSGDYLTSLTYRSREHASETMGHERHETKHRAQSRLVQLVAYWVSEGWEVRTPDVNKEDKWSFAKARSAPTPAHYGPPATGMLSIQSAAPPLMPMPKLVPVVPPVVMENPIVMPSASVTKDEVAQQLENLMREAMHCRECFARYGVEEPFITFAQPRWVGPRYSAAPFRVVVLMINPGESKDRPSARAYIPRAQAFREGKSDFRTFIGPQRHDMEGWGQGSRNPVEFYIRGLDLDMDEIAFANVAWCGTKGNKYPRPMLDHCFERFTVPLLTLLRPTAVLASGSATHAYADRVRMLLPDAATIPMLHYGHREGDAVNRAELARVRQALAEARQESSKGRLGSKGW